jgi:hypothetical protein
MTVYVRQNECTFHVMATLLIADKVLIFCCLLSGRRRRRRWTLERVGNNLLTL